MAKETELLAQYAAAALRYEDIPADVIARAKQCIADTIAVIICGYEQPWSRMIARYAEKYGVTGKSPVLGPGGVLFIVTAAPLASAPIPHSFYMDNLRWPNTGF